MPGMTTKTNADVTVRNPPSEREIQRLAEGFVRKSGNAISPADAYRRALLARPDLYARSLAEKGA